MVVDSTPTQGGREMDELREQMHREDAVIAASRQKTLQNLTDITNVLAELKAA